MPASTRGRLRNLLKCVPVNTSLKYGFKTADLAAVQGVSAADIAALGQQDVTSGSGLVVLSPRSPKPAQFRKKLVGSPQTSVSAYGDGTSAQVVNAAAALGWVMSKGPSAASFGSTTRSLCVGITTSNGLIVRYFVPIGDAGHATLLGWDTAVANTDKLVVAPQGGKVALAKTKSGQNWITLPCSYNKQNDVKATAGWKLARAESGFIPVAAAS